jgi:hypothetical protein
MNALKPWYMSRTIWASLITIAATAVSALGVPIDEAAVGALTDGVLQTIAAIGSVAAIVGRLSATARIG